MLTWFSTPERLDLFRAAAEESVRIAWVAVLVLLGARLPRAVAAVRGLRLADWLPWAVVFLVALFARLVLAEATVVNENRHGEMFHLRVLAGGHLDTYGPAYFETFRALLSLLPPRLETLLAVNAVLGSLSCVLAGHVTLRLLEGSRAEGLAAATILALLPMHVRVSHSESLFVLGSFLSVAALVLVAVARTRGSAAAWWSAWLLAAIALQVRPEYLVLPAFLLLAAWAARPSEAGLGVHRFAAPAACALLAAPRLLVLAGLHATENVGSILAVRAAFDRLVALDHLATNPRLFPLAVTILGLVGLLAVARRHLRGAVFVGAILAFHTIWFLALQPNLGNVLRFQFTAVWVWAVLAAAGGVLLVDAATSPRARVALAASLALLLLGSAWPSARLLTHRFDKDEEFRFLREAARHLPAEGHLVLPSQDAFGDGRILAYFLPEVLPERGRRWQVHRQAEGDVFDRDTLRSLGAPVYYYRGIWAYEFNPEELPPRDPGDHGPLRANPFFDHEHTSPGVTAWALTESAMMRPEIAALESRYRLEAVAEHTFEARPYHRWIVPQKRLTIGFYRIADVAPAPSPQGASRERASPGHPPPEPGSEGRVEEGEHLLEAGETDPEGRR